MFQIALRQIRKNISFVPMMEKYCRARKLFDTLIHLLWQHLTQTIFGILRNENRWFCCPLVFEFKHRTMIIIAFRKLNIYSHQQIIGNSLEKGHEIRHFKKHHLRKSLEYHNVFKMHHKMNNGADNNLFYQSNYP